MPAAESVIYRAPYLVPVSSPVIPDGGVLVRAGRIVAVDRFCQLASADARVKDLDGRIITPALINCHCHLELSHLADLGREAAPDGGMTGWIRALLARRQDYAPETAPAAGREALRFMHRRGVALVADIGNLPASAGIGQGCETEARFFWEFLGSTEAAAEAALANLPDNACDCAAHAPYSCHPRLLKGLKARAVARGRLLPIHLAESEEEVEFLATGQGPFRDFIGERLRLSGLLAEGQALSELMPSPGLSPVAYLRQLGILDGDTLCVHLVHLTVQDLGLLAASGARACLCPGSNRHLGVGRAPAPELLRHHILPGLGTDSLASNEQLDIWREMAILQADHPGLKPELIFRMATLGGARALKVSQRLGAMAPSLEAKLLAVPFAGREEEIFSFLVNGGQAVAPQWLEVD